MSIIKRLIYKIKTVFQNVNEHERMIPTEFIFGDSAEDIDYYYDKVKNHGWSIKACRDHYTEQRVVIICPDVFNPEELSRLHSSVETHKMFCMTDNSKDKINE